MAIKAKSPWMTVCITRRILVRRDQCDANSIPGIPDETSHMGEDWDRMMFVGEVGQKITTKTGIAEELIANESALKFGSKAHEEWLAEKAKEERRSLIRKHGDTEDKQVVSDNEEAESKSKSEKRGKAPTLSRR